MHFDVTWVLSRTLMHIHQWISSSWMYHIVDSLILNSHPQYYIMPEWSFSHTCIFSVNHSLLALHNCSTIPGKYKKVSLNRLQKNTPVYMMRGETRRQSCWLVQSQLGTCALGGSNFLLLSMSANYNKTMDFEHNSQHRICKWFWGSTILWSSYWWVLFISCSAESTPRLFIHMAM